MPNSKKRLIVCLDGTGQDSVRGTTQITNVTRFARCVKTSTEDAIQIVYYHEGCGVYREGDLPGNATMGAATGQGVHAVVQDAYYFLCLNYEEKDKSEIHLVGFSRGAFAARALACLIDRVGLLKRSRLACLAMVYELWKSEGPRLQSKQLKREDSVLAEHVETWKRGNHLIRSVEISTCAVWDTVNSMRSKELDFVGELIPENLQNAFHALALHETRDDFKPVLWDEKGSRTRIRECWFAGDHSDVGGGNADSGFATLTLIWMVSQFKEYTNIGFDDLMLMDCMTPQFLEWKDANYRLVSHDPTQGIIHGSGDWEGLVKYWFEYRSHTDTRKPYLMSNNQSNSPKPLTFFRAKRPLEPDSAKKRGRRTAPVEIELETDRLDEEDAEVPKMEKTSKPTSVSQIPGPFTDPTVHRQLVHFTVRVIMCKRKESCKQNLEEFCTKKVGTKPHIWWNTKDRHEYGLWEDHASGWENWMFRQWIKREEKRFPDPTIRRFTHFLKSQRAEGFEQKLLYCGSHDPNCGSVTRSRRRSDSRTRTDRTGVLHPISDTEDEHDGPS